MKERKYVQSGSLPYLHTGFVLMLHHTLGPPPSMVVSYLRAFPHASLKSHYTNEVKKEKRKRKRKRTRKRKREKEKRKKEKRR